MFTAVFTEHRVTTTEVYIIITDGELVAAYTRLNHNSSALFTTVRVKPLVVASVPDCLEVKTRLALVVATRFF